MGAVATCMAGFGGFTSSEIADLAARPLWIGPNT